MDKRGFKGGQGRETFLQHRDGTAVMAGRGKLDHQHMRGLQLKLET